MILSGLEIVSLIKRTKRLKAAGLFDPEGLHRGEQLIDISPFDPENVNPNSYNVALGPVLREYLLTKDRWYLDPDRDNPTVDHDVTRGGVVLMPNRLYLGATAEWTETYGLVPEIDGRSSAARLGIQMHAAAGLGDVGFCGRFVLEITVTHPVLVRPGLKLAQIKYHTVSRNHVPYKGRYAGQDGPVACRLWVDTAKGTSDEAQADGAGG